MAATSTTPLLLRVISSSVRVVDRAGKIIRDVMNKGDLGIVEKGQNDLQTEADRSAQHCIVSSLARQFPKIEIIGEETLESTEVENEDFLVGDYEPEILKMKCPDEFQAITDDDVVIWVDPVDGTSEYTQGLLEHVTVLIGISVHGKAIGGVIHQPYFNHKKAKHSDELGRTIWGLMGLGAFGITPEKPPEGKRIITTTRSHSSPEVQAALNAMDPTDIIRVGGAGHKVLLLLEGIAHAYVFASPGCKKWDTCAPEAILHAVGGCLTDVHGNAMQYHKSVKHRNSGGVLATYDKSVHDWYLKRIPEDVKQKLQP